MEAFPLLKSLLDNGSPQIEFETDEDRSYFQAILRIHPDFSVEKETFEGAVEGATAAVKKRLTKLLLAIVTNERKRVPEYNEMTGISPKTVERYIKILWDHELIEFTDEASHNGGYILHPKILYYRSRQRRSSAETR